VDGMSQLDTTIRTISAKTGQSETRMSRLDRRV
jgi:hypothetical protein